MTKPNAIEEIMADAVLHCDPASANPRWTYLQQAQYIINHLDAAGFVVMKKAEVEADMEELQYWRDRE